jgi:5,10-methylene-tetrahydrofolate dehydrogenase/methenyl tetrahydrofolate cyclohydrolase
MAQGITTDKTYQVRSEGIYHGLPVIDPKVQGLRAIVVGASSQSGQPVVDVLSSNLERWTKVYALSRRAPATTAENIEHIAIDLLWEPDRIAEALRHQDVQA